MSTYQMCYYNCNGVIIWSICKRIIPCICIHHAYVCMHMHANTQRVCSIKLKELTKSTNPHIQLHNNQCHHLLCSTQFDIQKKLCACVHITYDRLLLRVVLSLIWKMFYLLKHSKNKCKQTPNLCSLKSDWTLWDRLLLWQSCPSRAQCTGRTWIEGIWYYRKSDNEEIHNLYILLKWPSQQMGHAACIRENEK